MRVSLPLPRSISKLAEIVPLYAYASAIIDNATCYVTLNYIAMTLRGSLKKSNLMLSALTFELMQE